MGNRRAVSISVIAGILLLAAACSPRIVTVTVTVPPETLVVTATPAVGTPAVGTLAVGTPAPAPEPSAAPAAAPGDRSLMVCLVGEPDTLYLYSGSRLPATRHLMAALYDGPIDQVDFAYQPVILEKTPALADGDAITRIFRARTGDRVVDVQGQVVELAEGVRVRPADCRSPECEVDFAGEPVLMERLEVTFVLRQDVTWADGQPLTARDSVFAYRIADDPRTPSDHYLTDRTADYRAVDDWRVKWIGLPGFVAPDYASFFFPPLPRHQLEDLSAAQLVRADETRRTPLTWGPFVVSEWAVGEFMRLTRNPHYFRAAEGLPVLDELVFVFVSSPAEAAARVLAGECDAALRDAYDPYLPLLTQAERRGLLQVISAPGARGVQLDLGIVPVPSYRRPDFFGDVRVRQAIAHCIDRQALADAVTGGRGAVADSYYPPAQPLNAAAALARWPYDPAAGLRLLEEAGWVDEDGDGVNEAHGLPTILDGTLFDVTLLVGWSRAPLEEAGRIVRANLADCGIRVALEFRPMQDVLAEGPWGPLHGRQFDMALREWEYDAAACSGYLSDEIPDEGSWNGSNVSGYRNPEYDAVCRSALAALPGTTAYATAQQQALEMFSAELPAVPLWVWPEVSLARSGVLNLALDATSESELWRAETLDVD